MELEIIKEYGLFGAGVVGIFFLFKNLIDDTQKQNNYMMNHLMETNRQLHETSTEIITKFGNSIEEHTKAIQELRDEIKKLDGKK